MRGMWRAAGIVAGTALLAACRGGSERREPEKAADTVERTYGRPAEETWAAILSALRELRLTVESDHHDALGGDLVGRRGNKDRDRILVRARSVDPRSTLVSVSLEPGDRNLAEIIHRRIGERLGMGVSGDDGREPAPPGEAPGDGGKEP
jgi:hypothetical protein